MKAALLTAPKTFQIAEVDFPKPKKNEVTVKVRCAGICGSDLHFYETGRIGDVFLQEPFIMGHEFMGVIADPNGVAGAPPAGTRVAVDPAVSCGECPFCRAGRENICPRVQFTGFPPYAGAFAEYVNIPVENVFPLPDAVSDDEGPVLETLAVALHGLELMPPVRGRTCAVLGAGSVGLLTLLALQQQGAQVVLITEPVAERRELARRLGGSSVCHPEDTDSIRETLKRATPFGPEFIFETAGEEASFQMAFDLASPGGELCVYGIEPHGKLSLDFTPFRRKELRMVYVRRSLPANYPEAVRLVAEKRIEIQPLITHHVTLSQISQGFEIAAERSEGALKVIVQI